MASRPEAWLPSGWPIRDDSVIKDLLNRKQVLTGTVLALCVLLGYLATTSIGPPLTAAAVGVVGVVLVRDYLRLPVVVLGILFTFAGYVLLNRNFAELQVRAGPLPIYIGELVLGVALPWAILKWPRESVRSTSLVWVMLALWLVYATGRLIAGGFDYGIDGIRDFALAYYALFIVVGYAVWPSMSREGWTRFFTWLFIVLMPVETYFVVAGPFGLPIPGSSDTTLANRADVMAVSLIAAATFFLLVLRSKKYSAARLAISSFALTLVLPLEVRAATIGAILLLGVFAFQRRWVTLAGLIGLPILAFALLSLAGVEIRGRNGSSSPELWINRQVSTVSAVVGGQAASDAARGVLSTQDVGTDTIAWRLAWWNALFTEVTSSVDKTAFGLGFGADLTEPLGFQPDPTNTRLVRSPHNFLVTLLSRTGVIGLSLWLAALAACLIPVVHGIRGATRAGQRDDADYVLWLVAYPLTIIVAAVFGVVLEGPYGAIPCYLLLGMSLRAGEALATGRSRAL
jgi:hypothetical protein